MEASDLAFFDFSCNKEISLGDLGVPSNLFPRSHAKAAQSLTPRIFTCSAPCPNFPESLASLTLTSEASTPFQLQPWESSFSQLMLGQSEMLL